MSKLKATSAVHNVADLENLKRFVNTFMEDVFDVVNGKLEPGSNLWTDFVEVTFVAANTEAQVKHKLQKVPVAYILAGSDAATQLYDGIGNWTKEAIYLKSTVATTVRIFLF